jgi:hypothetical protein
MKSNSALQNLIRNRRINKMLREREQRQLIIPEEVYQQAIVAKLTGLWATPQFDNLARCGHEEIFRTCKCCGDVQTFFYRCDLKFCPRCQWRISKSREEKIAVWTRTVKQPKHLVLTQKNFPILTRSKLKAHRLALAKIRRHQCFDSVRGGCVSVEITNEGRGWHLHSHWLLDCDWLDMPAVSRAWGALVGQEFAIAKVKDVRGTDFVHEVCKYLAKGNEIAAWPAEQILEFVTAIRGCRFFFQFGSLFHLRDKVKQQLAFMRPETPACTCGSKDFRFEQEADHALREIHESLRHGTRPRGITRAELNARIEQRKLRHGKITPSAPALF